MNRLEEITRNIRSLKWSLAHILTIKGLSIIMSPVASEFELNLFMSLTLVLLAVKAILCIYLGKKLLEKKRETGKWTFNFITAIFLLLISFLVSRFVYLYFDFFLTKLDADTYYLMPNILVWKWGVALSTIGFVMLLFFLDKKVLNFKLKGIPAYFVLGIILFMLILPVNSPGDFVFVSALGIVGGTSGIIVLVIFLYIGITIPGLRRPAFWILAGFITYVAGATLYSEFVVSILITMFGPEVRVIAYTLFITLKIVGLIVIAYSVTKFSL